MKAYTDIEQSKKLAEILPLESADTIWNLTNPDLPNIRAIPYENSDYNNKYLNIIPAWSLAALLDVIPYTIYKSDNEFYRLGIDKGYDDYAIWYNNNGFTITDLDVTSDNFVDACVAMIEKLHEQKLL